MDAAVTLGGVARVLPALGLVVAICLVAGALAVPSGGAAGAREIPSASATFPLKGNVTGPTVFGYNDHRTMFINGTGGPAFASNGTRVGNLTYYASVTGVNLTGVSIVPDEAAIVNTTPQSTLLTVGNVTEVLTVVVEVTSTYQGANESLNLTYTVNVVQPYTLTMTLLSTTSATILGFTLAVDLDGVPVGTISIPALTGKESYVATFAYATLGLGSGYHTFTVSLANEHGLVTFAGGGSTYSTTFYVPGPPPNYEIWYIAGAVAFFGAVFIFITRLAARRRNPTRK